MNDPADQNTVTTDTFRRIRRIFEEALERPEGRRRAFVENACAGHATLLREVNRMLAAEGQPDPLLDGIASAPPSSSAPEEGRFPAGTVLAGRYRILGLLGKGGMGEVYRAHDLILNQTVALKFLSPAHISEAALIRFRNEVRIARQVSHPNVCRVYDLGMVEGLHFLSMEYIDGEDLASLLRRIGRLPQDKAVEFTRKICAGLSAAHERGVLHRDLKPANIMIDGRGQVRITDFGLAALAVEIPLSDLRSGTPAYMSPEQKAGKDVTTRSDIYSLGLVLHEMFTGKARRGTQSSPGEIVKDLDPAIERLILRCLEEDPRRRPQTALNVAMALPGADPIAAALAAGETPSPEMVAASGSNEALPPKTAIALLAGIAAGLVALCLLTPKLHMLSQLPLEHPPEVLAEKAREIARSLGYTERAADAAQGFDYDSGHVAYMEKKISGMEAWRRTLASPPSPVSFWYRQSRFRLEALDLNNLGGPQIVTATNPPTVFPGMVSARLDLDGGLLQFRAVPDTEERAPARPPASQGMPWSALFAAAHLDQAQFAATEPRTPLPLGADTRVAWTGAYRNHADLPVRVEAATAHGQPVSFEILWPWSKAERAPTPPAPPLVFRVFQAAIFLAFAIACLVARYNWKTGRGDMRGSLRLTVFFTVAWFATVGLATRFAGAGEIGGLLWAAIGDAVILAVSYLAIEPWVRRQWPQAMITWSRVLEGRWRDPAVSRDVLVGLVWAVAAGLYFLLRTYVDIRLGDAPAWDTKILGPSLQPNLVSARMVLAGIFSALRIGVVFPLFLFSLIVFLWMLVRKRSLGGVMVAALLVAVQSAGATHWVDWLFSAGGVAVFIYTMQRFGVFVAMVYFATVNLIAASLLTSDLTAWYGFSSMIAVVFISALALAAFRLSLGERPLFEVKPG